MKSMTTLTKNGRIRFDNRFVEGLPGDPNRSKWPRQVHGACYSRVQPTPVEKPEVVAWSREVAERLDLRCPALRQAQEPPVEGSAEFVESAQFAQVFGGNQLLDGMDPYAMCYGGHQFGNWAGQLGDGRAINLGTLVNREGEHWTLQLKGAGMTPYSRRGDGLAVLRSSIREFLCSEAMHHLGVPTTRALSLVTTGEKVMRDMFYDGHPGLELGAIVCRVAPSFTRFGNFQIFASRNELDVLQQLLDYTIRHDFPHLGEPSKEVYAQWFREVAQRTAEMIIHWMRVGFVHGVMNTDNMSILGLTIDYGPYGWLEDYDPNWTPNTTDAQHRRYRFGNQPQIAQWNLVQLGNALVQLTRDVEPLQAAINEYAQGFTQGYQEMMASKLGLRAYLPESDKALINDLQQILVLAETDMTIFFRKLADFPANQAPAPAEEPSNQPNQSNQERCPEPVEGLMAPLLDAYYVPEQLTDPVKEQIGTWLRTYRARLALDNRPHAERRTQMNAVNPKYVLRNYMAQLAIDQAETGDHTLLWELLDLLRHPYHEQPAMQKHAAKRPDWARHRAGCSMLSCSS